MNPGSYESSLLLSSRSARAQSIPKSSSFVVPAYLAMTRIQQQNLQCDQGDRHDDRGDRCSESSEFRKIAGTM